MEQATTFETNRTGRRVAGRFRASSAAALRAEREQLQEEVRQLRAAVQIYAEIARRTAERALGAAA